MLYFVWGLFLAYHISNMQLGYKTVLLICIGVSVVTSEAISFLPAFTEHKPQVAWDSLS